MSSINKDDRAQEHFDLKGESVSVLLDESSGYVTLPEKPSDRRQRPVKWVMVAKAPGFHAINKRNGQKIQIEVNGDWVKRQVAAYKRLQGKVVDGADYEAPILVEHKKDGERQGDVLTLGAANVDGSPALVAALAFNDREIESKIDDGYVRYFSPRFESIMDDEGVMHPFVLTEVSKTSSPHQKRLGVETHVLASEDENGINHGDEEKTMSREKKENQGKAEEVVAEVEIENNEVMGYPEMEARMTEQDKKIDDMKIMLGDLMKKLNPAEEAEVENKEAPASDEKDQVILALTEQVTTLAGQVGSLREDAQLADFESLVESRSDIALNEGSRKAMFNLFKSDPDSFKTMFSGVTVTNSESGIDFSKNEGHSEVSGAAGEFHANPLIELHEQCMSEADGDKLKAANLFVERRRKLVLPESLN